MFYTRSNGVRVLATVVGFAPDHLGNIVWICLVLPGTSADVKIWDTVITGAVRALCENAPVEYDQGGVRVAIMDAPWTPSPLVSPVSSLHHHPHQLPQLTSLRKFLWTPLLMEAPFTVAPRHDPHHIPHPEASLGELGD